MAENVYDELSRAFDALSFGFPKGMFGTDKAVLKKFFNKEDARHFVDMGQGYIVPADYAEKNGVSLEEATDILEGLAAKGLVFRRRRPDKNEYKQYPFMLGLIEFQTHNADQSWKLPVGMYIATSKLGERMGQTMPFYRTVPFEKEFVEGTEVMPYDDIKAVLDRHTVFSVMPCLCRMLFKTKPGNKCTHPDETCIMTDDHAQFILDYGWGRQITREEAYEILMEGERDGRVISVSNSQEGENICSCCGCGCGMLYLKAKYPGPSGDYWSNYFCTVDGDKCVSCGKCSERCPVNAVTVKNGKVEINLSYCIGCGLCVATCPTGALKLHRKDEDKLYTPPATYDDAIEVWQQKTKKG